MARTHSKAMAILDCIGLHEEVNSLELSMRVWYKHGHSIDPAVISNIANTRLVGQYLEKSRTGHRNAYRLNGANRRVP